MSSRLNKRMKKTKVDVKKTREASKEALKTVYYVVVGFAITEALTSVFVRQGSFIGSSLFSTGNIHPLLLLIVLLLMISSFVHGASIQLDVYSIDPDRRFEPLLDYGGFLVQAALFYLMALSIERPRAFSIFFALMVLCDALWILSLRAAGYIEKLKKTSALHWLISDFCILALLMVLICLDPTMTDFYSVWVLLIAVVIAFSLDYYVNRNFYFPTSKPRRKRKAKNPSGTWVHSLSPQLRGT